MTTSPKSEGVFPEDLVNRARSGQLSDSERRELGRVLDESAALRVAHQLGRDFDAIDAVCPGDDRLVTRLSERVVSSAHARRTQSPLTVRITSHAHFRASIVAATVLLGSVAAATTWGVRTWVRAAQLQVQMPLTVETASTAPLLHRLPTAVRAAGVVPMSSCVVAPNIDDEPVPRMALVRPETSGTRTNRIGAALPPPNPNLESVALEAKRAGDRDDAQSLFRHASEARRDGRVDLSRSLYMALQSRYPGSDEARLSHISTAKLLLSSGRTAEADAQFAAYLKWGGPLDAEALAGRAECQLRLEHREQERALWLELLSRFPSSVFAARGRQRLVVLGGDTP
jgi:hypothetical protein